MNEAYEQTGSGEKPVTEHEKRRCEHINEEGRRCARWASRGEELCHAHLRYAEARASRTVHVPLLEDEASILYVLSQTTHAVATGGMPPANGHAVISACKLATRILELRLKQKQWEAKHAMSPITGEMGHAVDPMSPKPGETEHPADPMSPKAGETEHPTDPMSPKPGDMGHPDSSRPEVDDATLMAVSDEAYDQPFVPAGQRACDRVQARVDAAEAARYAQEGPRVELPRFRKEDLKKQWEHGMQRPCFRNENNIFLSSEEKEAIRKWQSEHADLMRARHQRVLDEYFGRVKKDGTEASAR